MSSESKYRPGRLFKQEWLVAVLPGAIVFVMYALTSLPGAFYYDDLILLRDPAIGNLGAADFLRYTMGRPLTLFSYRLDIILAGQAVWWFHIVSIVLHSFNTAVASAVARKLTGNNAVGFWAGLLFGLHFLATEPANYIWARSVLLASLSILVGLWFFSSPEEKMPKSVRIGVTMVLLFGVMARPDAVLLLPFGILLRGFVHGRWWDPFYGWLAGVCALVGVAVVYILWSSPERSMGFDLDYGVFRWIEIVLATALSYFQLLVRASRMSIFHPVPTLNWSLWPGALVAAAFVSAVAWKRKEKLVLWLAASFAVLLLFTLAVPSSEPLGDRRLYLGIFCVVFLLVWIALGNTGSKGSVFGYRSRVLVLALVAVVVTAGSLRRNWDWNHPPRILWQAESLYPQAAKPQFLLALYFSGAETQKTENYLRNTIRRQHDFPSAHNNLGNIYMKQGRLSEALQEYRLELSHYPHSALAYNNLGVLYLQLERNEAAAAAFRQALRLDPNHTAAARNLATMESK